MVSLLASVSYTSRQSHPYHHHRNHPLPSRTLIFSFRDDIVRVGALLDTKDEEVSTHAHTRTQTGTFKCTHLQLQTNIIRCTFTLIRQAYLSPIRSKVTCHSPPTHSPPHPLTPPTHPTLSHPLTLPLNTHSLHPTHSSYSLTHSH